MFERLTRTEATLPIRIILHSLEAIYPILTLLYFTLLSLVYIPTKYLIYVILILGLVDLRLIKSFLSLYINLT